MRDLAYDFVENACKIEWKDIPPDVVDVTKNLYLIRLERYWLDQQHLDVKQL